MTERLAQLMHAEADRLDVPAPDPAAALSQGRGLRRKHRLATGVAALGVVAVIAGTALGVDAIVGDDGSKAEPATPDDTGAVFSIGNRVYLDGGAVDAAIDDKAIKSLYYTSAGVLVRHGNNTWSDGGGPQRFSLVRPDGSVARIDVTTEETVHSTDPTQPYLAYAEETDGGAGVEVVVRDVRDDTEAARVSVPGPFDRDAWMPPPVSLHGDLVYVGTSPTAYAVDWRSGEVTETDVVEPGEMPEVVGGRQVDSARGQTMVVDVATDEVLLAEPVGEDQYGYFDLSPDGRYALLSIEDLMGSPDGGSLTVDVYDVETGEHVSVPPAAYGWSSDGDLFSVSKAELTTCDAATGSCTTVAHGITMPKTVQEEVCQQMTMVLPRNAEKPETWRTECYTDPGLTWLEALKLGGRTYES